MKRRLASVVGAGMVAMLMAGSALAEGSWTSYMVAVLTGFESRIWTDRNTDGANTVIRFERCHWHNSGASVNNVTVNLRRVISAWPDENKGDKILYCSVAGSGNWGDVRAGDYRFKIAKINGQTTTSQGLDVPYVRVSY